MQNYAVMAYLRRYIPINVLYPGRREPSMVEEEFIRPNK